LARLELSNVSKNYGAFDAITDVSLAIEDESVKRYFGLTGVVRHHISWIAIIYLPGGDRQSKGGRP
jgi:ABC-type uncharacterized transport system ATPase subunit